MKRIICTLLIAGLLASTTITLSFAQNNDERVSVNVFCQNDYKFFNSRLSGILKDNEFYTTPEEINKLAGFNASQSIDNGYLFVNENHVERCPYILEGTVLTELFPYKESLRKWNIQTIVDNSGNTLVNFEEILYALGAEIKCSEGSDTVSVNFPYSIEQAILDVFHTQGSSFSWTEVGEDANNSNSIALLSSINSLLLDYNSHLVTDALFSWMDDNILNATEDQYFDTLKEIMCYTPENYSDLSDDMDYGTFETQNKAFSLTNDMADLLGLNIDEISYMGKVAEAGGYVEIAINSLNEYNLTRNITDTSTNVLKYGLVNCAEDSLFADEKVEPLIKAANHLYNLSDNNGIGITTELLDAIVEAGGSALGSASSTINPMLVAIQATEKIMKITPGLSGLTEKNEAIHTAANCYVIQELAFGEFARVYNKYRYDEIPDEDAKSQMKYMLILGLKASTTARDILLDYDLCGDYSYDVRNTNKRVSALLSRVEGIDFEITESNIGEFPILDNSLTDYESVVEPNFEYKQALIDSVDGNLIDFYFDDFDNDGQYEAFGITGELNDWCQDCYNNVSIYFIDNQLQVTKYKEQLYGSWVTENSKRLLDTGTDKFLMWEQHAHGSSAEVFLIGVRNGQTYEPKVSGEYCSISKQSETPNCFEFYSGSLSHPEKSIFSYNSNKHEFELSNEPASDTKEERIDVHNIPSDAVEFNNHYYYVYDIETIANWNMAQEFCESQGGYLATITSPEEDSFLYSYIKSLEYSSVLFGLTDQEQTGNWHWVTEEPFSYQNWHYGEPNNQGGYEHYGMYFERNSDGSWNDGSGGVCPFICEWGATECVTESTTEIPCCEYTFDEHCVWCNQTPTKEFITINGTACYVCEHHTKTCAVCNKTFDKELCHYTNLLDVELFMCDDCLKHIIMANEY